VSEVKACFIPLRGSPEAVNCEVRQQYPLLLTRLNHILKKRVDMLVDGLLTRTVESQVRPITNARH
jgi:hypothetical protein